jgi:hypothetical protein
LDIEFAWDEIIPNYAFSAGNNQTQLSKIILPSTLKSIGDQAFRGTKIKRIIHSGIAAAEEATGGLKNQETTLILPDSLQTIGASAFYNCLSLNSIVIPSTVTSIGVGAFRVCPSLQTVILYISQSDSKATEQGQGWFFASGTPGVTSIKVLQAIFNEEVGILPSEVFGDYWNEYSSDPVVYHSYSVIIDN